jgi:hypothetical protein
MPSEVKVGWVAIIGVALIAIGGALTWVGKDILAVRGFGGLLGIAGAFYETIAMAWYFFTIGGTKQGQR